jgi:hypothetical protein
MKVIKGNRRLLEHAVLKTLMSPATSEEIDKAIAKLKPQGQLKLVTSKLYARVKKPWIELTLSVPS